MTHPRIGNQEDWGRLIERLPGGDSLPPSTMEGGAPLFDDPHARNRVGQVITRAILRGPFYGTYRLYSADTPSKRS